MGFERITLFGTIELDMEATGLGTVILSTDLPGVKLDVRETKQTPATARRPVRLRLAGTTKGHLYTVRFLPSGVATARIYGIRLWARVLPGPWDWYSVPITPSGEEWTPLALDIPAVSDWQQQALDIPPVGEWTQQALDIPPLGEWTEARLPIKATPPVPEWIQIPVDA